MNSTPVNILLADDDIDDCSFFEAALTELQLPTSLTTVHDGEQLMRHLEDEKNTPTDILFLDINMPRKNGFECLAEIQQIKRLQLLPVFVFSTSFEISVVNLLYEQGARYFIRKPAGFLQYKNIVLRSLALIIDGVNAQPAREHFVITAQNSLII